MPDPGPTYPTQELEHFFRKKFGERACNFSASRIQELHSLQSYNELIAFEKIHLAGGDGCARQRDDQQVRGRFFGPALLRGGDISDVLEVQTIMRAKKLFGCQFVNVQPYSDAVGERIN